MPSPAQPPSIRILSIKQKRIEEIKCLFHKPLWYTIERQNRVPKSTWGIVTLVLKKRVYKLVFFSPIKMSCQSNRYQLITSLK